MNRTEIKVVEPKIPFFPGIPLFFNRINKFIAEESKNHAKVRHYIISSGLKEIINKTKLNCLISPGQVIKFRGRRIGSNLGKVDIF